MRNQFPPSSSPETVRVISPKLARRLAITRQRLAGSRPTADASGILDVVRDIRCLQIDPISAVAPSHLLVLWSRIGNYDVSVLNSLLSKERALFEYKAHAASIVLTEDYPIFSTIMRTYGTSYSAWSHRLLEWVQANQALSRHILTELRHRGPLSSSDFEDKSTRNWRSSGWTTGRNINMMLYFLWSKGKIMVAGRDGGRKLWDLTERFLPQWASSERLSWQETVYRAAQKSLRALGVAPASHVERYYIRGCYQGLPDVLAELESKGYIVPVQVIDPKKKTVWPKKWYVHSDDLPLLDKLSNGDWEPRTTLLSPFDNLICDRRRTELLFSFKPSLEIYVPRIRRKYGYYTLSILHGDHLIGRIDPIMDRVRGRLVINAVYAEPEAPMTSKTARDIANAIEELSLFLGADRIDYGQKVPEGWKSRLH